MEVVTNNNDGLGIAETNWNENKVQALSRNDWRASLVPAAAVIPAPMVYINAVAVKKLVVGFVLRYAPGQGKTLLFRRSNF